MTLRQFARFDNYDCNRLSGKETSLRCPRPRVGVGGMNGRAIPERGNGLRRVKQEGAPPSSLGARLLSACQRAIAALLLLGLAGCAVGPNYHRPSLDIPGEFRGEPKTA